MKGVFLDTESLAPQDLDLSPLQQHDIDWQFFENTPTELVSERIRDADFVISNKVPLSAKHLATAQHLKMVNVAATGTNHIDLEACQEQGVHVRNCQGYGTQAVVQHALALLLALACRLRENTQLVRAGDWQRADQFCLLDAPGMELAGKTMGIIGFGELGQAMGDLAEALGMRVLVAERPNHPQREGRLPLAELLPQVDVLSIHCPLTQQTRDMIDAAELQQMKPSALLINTARGGIVNESALAQALLRKTIGGAALDVLSEEPPRQGNPLLALNLPNLIITPHMAWGAQASRQRLVQQLAENIDAYWQSSTVRQIC